MTIDSPGQRYAGPPLFACGGKRGFENRKIRIKLLHPLSSEAEERVDKRSNVGVSKLYKR